MSLVSRVSRREAKASAEESAAAGLVGEVRFVLVERRYGSTTWHCKYRGVLQLGQTLFMVCLIYFGWTVPHLTGIWLLSWSGQVWSVFCRSLCARGHQKTH